MREDGVDGAGDAFWSGMALAQLTIFSPRFVPCLCPQHVTLALPGCGFCPGPTWHLSGTSPACSG